MTDSASIQSPTSPATAPISPSQSATLNNDASAQITASPVASSSQGAIQDQTPPFSLPDSVSVQSLINSQTAPISTPRSTTLNNDISTQSIASAVASSLQDTVNDQTASVSLTNSADTQISSNTQTPSISLTASATQTNGASDQRITSITVSSPQSTTKDQIAPVPLTAPANTQTSPNPQTANLQTASIPLTDSVTRTNGASEQSMAPLAASSPQGTTKDQITPVSPPASANSQILSDPQTVNPQQPFPPASANSQTLSDPQIVNPQPPPISKADQTIQDNGASTRTTVSNTATNPQVSLGSPISTRSLIDPQAATVSAAGLNTDTDGAPVQTRGTSTQMSIGGDSTLSTFIVPVESAQSNNGVGDQCYQPPAPEAGSMSSPSTPTSSQASNQTSSASSPYNAFNVKVGSGYDQLAHSGPCTIAHNPNALARFVQDRLANLTDAQREALKSEIESQFAEIVDDLFASAGQPGSQQTAGAAAEPGPQDLADQSCSRLEELHEQLITNVFFMAMTIQTVLQQYADVRDVIVQQCQ